jgi:Tfp pilus assembly PilM family ATPase
MPEFGIYFGSEVINITAVKGKRILANISIPQAKIIGSELEQKIPDERKISAVLKGEFVKNNISPDNVSIAISGEDLIVRTFDLPIFLPKKELNYNTIAFEAKKYIPFKIEDVAFDFRFRANREDKKFLVLFAGIKKEILNNYLSIFKELQIKIRLAEYAGFSILRLLPLGGLKNRGILGLLNVDLDDETNFLVCQAGFPLFSRDINLIPRSESESLAGGTSSEKTDKLSSTAKLIFMEKLKSEIRISLDFFRRKFPDKPLDKIIILSLPQFQTEIATLLKELGLPAIPLETSKFLDKDFEFSAALAKSYATAISNVQRLRFPINLLRPAVKREAVKGLSIKALPIEITPLRINPKVILLAFLVIFLTVGRGWYKRQLPLNELKIVKGEQPKIEGISGEQSSSALADLEKEYINKINIMKDMVKDKFYVTEALDAIPRLMPEGAWLNSLSFQILHDRLELRLEGMVFLDDLDKEFAVVNDIVSGLKNNSNFSRRFREINVVSMERDELAILKSEGTKFVILCH